MKKVFLFSFVTVLIATVIAVCLSINNGGYVNYNEQWIGYVGSITGGILTLGGVWWTIHDNERQRLEENKPMIVPYVKVISDSKEFGGNYVRILIEIKNTGNALATDFKCYNSLSKRTNTDGDALTSSYLLPGACHNLLVGVLYSSMNDLQFEIDVEYCYKPLNTKYCLKYEVECVRTLNNELISYVALENYNESKMGI